ncbi:MAG: pilus assembly protein PilB [Planctomycetes bacterium]|nr:pilus assembly protein PilB [Planctomycetota bacterium]
MSNEPRKLLGQVLKEHRACHQGQIQEGLTVQREKGGQIGQILIQLGHISHQELLKALAEQAGMPMVDLGATDIPDDVISKVDPQTAQAFRVVPFRVEGGVLHVALADPMNTSVLDDLGFMTGMTVKGALAEDAAIDEVIKKRIAQEEDLDSLLDELESEGGSIDDAENLARSAPVVRLLNYILFAAIRDRSSDIHLEPFEDEFRIRYRVDGTLFELRSPPKHLAVALISRVKVLANLDIAETRVPQDGRIDLLVGGRQVDIRVSTLPTMFGESCVMRILDRSVVSLDIDKLGLRGDDMAVLKDLIDRPHGIVLVTGPTGSGKTTTLYSCLNAINDEGIKIITTEDPVEYDLDGIVQVQVNEDIGVSYGTCLRSILRQDPDKILVGEIRDAETAQIAVEAALTGHLVFSTLHTNDAPSAITRLVDIGVESYLVAATLEAIVAQRLIRTICQSCREWAAPADEVLYELGLTRDAVGTKEFAFGRGCDACHGTGYRGRMAIFEVMIMNEALAHLLVDNASLGRLRDKAREFGMRTLRDSGVLAVFDGLTTPEEIVRETLATW